MLEVTDRCFHCGEPLVPRRGEPRGSSDPLTVNVRGEDVAVCCHGCRAAVQWVESMGLEDFYRFRTESSPRPKESTTEWLAYDAPELLDAFTTVDAAERRILLMIEGMNCAACSWLINRSLERIEGVRQISVNTATGRAEIAWDATRVALSRLMEVIASLGYTPQIITPDAADARIRDERRALLKRLAVAGLGMMQVMMFAVAMYAADLQGGMDADVRSYLRLVSMLVATPVMLYGGWPFFVAAARALSIRAITMDVPVSLGLALAYGASVFDTWRHAGEVYFDSVTMFIFFLTVARYVEMVARHQSTRVSDSLARMLPATAHRLTADGSDQQVTEVPASTLLLNDRLLVRVGEVVPADGRIVRGSSQFDESMLTGEALPVDRSMGSAIVAGTLNLGAPVEMQVTAAGRTTVLAGIVSLLNRAQSERPRLTRAGDRFASRFLARVIAGAALVCLFWCLVDPSRAFAATLAVLVVACPCAFSLSTLVAVASANAALARRGVLVTSPDAIEGLAGVTRVVFDKTGTLTDGRIVISGCTPLGPLSATECLRIAAALERGSEHPIARAFAAIDASNLDAHDTRIVPGGGIAGTIEGTAYRIGTRSFASPSTQAPDEAADIGIVLCCDSGDLATFAFADQPRPEGAGSIAALHTLGLATEILSGDSLSAVRRLAQRCGIDTFAARRSPAQKLEHIRQLTSRGDLVAMVGDGINDAPVLAGAGVSIAMGRGSALALANADLILVNDSLLALPGAFQLARQAMRVVRQNLAWAAAYNLTAMPLAAMGWVPPWAAAIGMSASSILVVLNSLRLMRATAPRPLAPAASAPGHSLMEAPL